MKTKLLLIAALLTGTLLGCISTTVATRLAPLSGADREALVADLRELANDDSSFLWMEYYEVGYPPRDSDYYLSEFNFERIKDARRSGLRSAAYILEHYEPTPAAITLADEPAKPAKSRSRSPRP